MSDKLARSATYYAVLAKKHEDSGRGPNQARIYRELVQLVGECSSYEEIQRRMKAEGYYESPGQAIVLDKHLAHRDAAKVLGFERLAALHQARYDAVAADASAAWTSGWEEQVKTELNRIGELVDAFHGMLCSWVEYRCAAEVGRASPLDKLRAAVARFEQHGSDFRSVVTNLYFRRHSALDDAWYRVAVREIHGLLREAPDDAAAEASVTARAQALIDNGDQAALRTLRSAYEARQRRSAHLCVAPDTEPGPYTYEPFYEGAL